MKVVGRGSWGVIELYVLFDYVSGDLIPVVLGMPVPPGRLRPAFVPPTTPSQSRDLSLSGYILAFHKLLKLPQSTLVPHHPPRYTLHPPATRPITAPTLFFPFSTLAWDSILHTLLSLISPPRRHYVLSGTTVAPSHAEFYFSCSSWYPFPSSPKAVPRPQSTPLTPLAIGFVSLPLRN